MKVARTGTRKTAHLHACAVITATLALTGCQTTGSTAPISTAKLKDDQRATVFRECFMTVTERYSSRYLNLSALHNQCRRYARMKVP